MSQPAPITRDIGNMVVRIILGPWRAFRWCCRGLWRRRRALLYIVIALVVIHLTATAITGLMLRNEIARLKSTGYLLTTDQLIPHVPPGEKNAADIYQKAFDARRIAREDEEQLMGLRLFKWTPDITTAARRVVSANSEYYKLIAGAARTPNCAFPKDWTAGPNTVFPEFAKLREPRACSRCALPFQRGRAVRTTPLPTLAPYCASLGIRCSRRH